MKLQLLPLLAAPILISACHSTTSGSSAPAETVEVTTPQVKDVVLTATYPGTLTANATVDVVARVNAQILSKNFTSGSMVNKGDVLFTMDPSTYQDQVRQAQATLTTAIATRDYAVEHYAAVRKALESEAVSKMEVEQAKSAYEQAESSVKSAQAALDNARRQLSYCTITAPISGMVADDTNSAGSYISGQGSPVVMTTIYDITSLSVNFAIEDKRYQDIVNAIQSTDSIDFQNVPVTFEDHLPHSYTGYISYMAPSLNKSTGTLSVKCKVQNPYSELRPGMYAKVNLPYGRVRDAILVDDSSIASDQLGKYLYVVNDSNKVVYTPVTVGDLYQDTLRIVTSGLNPGDRYVTKAQLKVRNGMTVNPVERK
ncbi:MAG: efflux RND transporter periplasmic adaptor subunit [Duncaniella sp.]|nr:efflux RND transporter periplasmic adaptor subunit [Duncaniella sp.]